MNGPTRATGSGALVGLLLGLLPGCTALNPAFSPDSDSQGGSGSASSTGSTSSPVSASNPSMGAGSATGSASMSTSIPTMGDSDVSSDSADESSETGRPDPRDVARPVGPYCSQRPGLLICQDFDVVPRGQVLPSTVGAFPLELEFGEWDFVETDLGMGQDYEGGQRTRITDGLALGEALHQGFTFDAVITLDQSGENESSTVASMREFIRLDANVLGGDPSLSCGLRGLKTDTVQLEYDEPYHVFCSVTDRPTLVVIPLGRGGMVEVRFAEGLGVELAESESLEGLFIGRGAPVDRGSGPFDGVIDGYRVWQRALSVDEICILEAC